MNKPVVVKLVREIINGDVSLQIFQDTHLVHNPRDVTDFGKMIFWHPYIVFGDEVHVSRDGLYNRIIELAKAIDPVALKTKLREYLVRGIEPVADEKDLYVAETLWHSDIKGSLEEIESKIDEHIEAQIQSERLPYEVAYAVLEEATVLLPYSYSEKEGFKPAEALWKDVDLRRGDVGIGMIFAPLTRVHEKYGENGRKLAEEHLRDDIRQYDAYLRDEVYSWNLRNLKDGEKICFGFFSFGWSELKEDLREGLPEEYADLVKHV